MAQVTDGFVSGVTRHMEHVDRHLYSTVPPVMLLPGEQNGWCVEAFTISNEDAQRWNLGQALNSHRDYVVPGTFTRLLQDGQVWMSDTPSERQDHSEFARHAAGTVLITELGLGVAVQAALRKRSVSTVWVIEQSSDVIDLVGWQYEARYGDRIKIIQADALTWKPPKGVQFDVIWHDIWPTISGDNRPTMSTLHRRYARWKAQGGWQDSWKRDEIDYYLRASCW